MNRKRYIKLPYETFKAMKKQGITRAEFMQERELDDFTRTIAVEVIEAEEKVVFEAVLTAAKEAGVDTLYILTKEFILSALKHEAERRKGAKQ